MVKFTEDEIERRSSRSMSDRAKERAIFYLMVAEELGLTKEQNHLDGGTPERDYWHYGYGVGVLDILRSFDLVERDEPLGEPSCGMGSTALKLIEELVIDKEQLREEARKIVLEEHPGWITK